MNMRELREVHGKCSASRLRPPFTSKASQYHHLQKLDKVLAVLTTVKPLLTHVLSVALVRQMSSSSAAGSGQQIAAAKVVTSVTRFAVGQAAKAVYNHYQPQMKPDAKPAPAPTPAPTPSPAPTPKK